jgi:hypothetical protein
MVNWSSSILAFQIRLQTGIRESVVYDEKTIKTLKQIFLFCFTQIHHQRFPIHTHSHTLQPKKERETSALSSSAIQAAL